MLLHFLSAHPLHTAIFLRRPRCLQRLIEAGSSVVTAYPGKMNKTILLAVSRISNTPVGSTDAEKVVRMLLETDEGKRALNVIDPRTEDSALHQCISCLSENSKTGEDNATKAEALARVMELLLQAGASQDLPSRQLSALAKACFKGVPTKIVDVLLKYGADPHSCYVETGINCLTTALASSQVGSVKTLLEHGVSVNARNPNGCTPLEMAIRKGNEECLNVIVNHPTFRLHKSSRLSSFKNSLKSPEEKYYSFKMENNETNEHNTTKEDCEADPKLIELVNGGDSDKLADILERKASLNLNVQCKSGMTALHMATIRNDIDMAELLLKYGAKTNVKDASGNCPLVYAARLSNALEIIDLLISHAANVNEAGSMGKTALFQAVQSARIENVEYLCMDTCASASLGESTTGTTPLHLMAQEDNTLMIEILSGACDANVNNLNMFGAGPLHYAAKSDSKKAAEMLILKGASVDLKCTILGNTPLHVAAASNSMEVALALIDKGAHVNARNGEHETPLFLAAMTGHEPLLKILLDAEADIEAKNRHGQSPLTIALTYKEEKVAQYLIQQGADIFARECIRKETILHVATSAESIRLCISLIVKGADKEARDCHGYTPLLRSAIIPFPELTRVLLRLGCNPSATLYDHRKSNFLDLMMDSFNEDVLKEVVTLCPRTRRPRLHPAFKDLPEESKERPLKTWHLNYQRFGDCWATSG